MKPGRIPRRIRKQAWRDASSPTPRAHRIAQAEERRRRREQQRLLDAWWERALAPLQRAAERAQAQFAELYGRAFASFGGSRGEEAMPFDPASLPRRPGERLNRYRRRMRRALARHLIARWGYLALGHVVPAPNTHPKELTC